MELRTTLREHDASAVGQLVAATGFFSADEAVIATELVDETRARGPASGYAFVFADAPQPGELLGYACYGPIPATQSSYDLYWIAVAPRHQHQGLGKALIVAAERLSKEQGATQMFVDTSGRGQYAATRKFYQRVGYRQVALLEDFFAPGDPKVVYSKRL